MNLWERRLRLYSGLIIAVFVIQHLINHSLGMFGFEVAEIWREWWSPIWDATVIKLTLLASLVTHFLLALWRLFQRRTLALPRWEMTQMLFGLSIAPLMIGHLTGTRFAAEIAGLDPDYYFVVTAQVLKPRYLVQMPILILVVWIHVTLGLHFWLRLYDWYRKSFEFWLVLAVALPCLSISGFLSLVREASQWSSNPEALGDIFYEWNDVPQAVQTQVLGLEERWLWILFGCLVMTLIARELRRKIERRTSEFNISHSNGKTIMARKGQTLLEALRMSGIRHASVCGGRGRCTTCRVRVGIGRDQLAIPGDIEQQALNRINAGEGVRLACQIRPSASLAITPLVNVNDNTEQALHSRGGVQGDEREVVCMFVDMRGSTRMGERILPYDVVFILNQFFTELSASLDSTNGHYAQFTGDGLMALYGLESGQAERSARDALAGAVMMFDRLDALNQRLQPEFGQSVQMGIGIHGGVAIVGRMGPPSAPLMTAIGDNINIAARLESMTKTEQCDIIVSREVISQTGINLDDIGIRTLAVRGREDGIEVAALDIHTLRKLIK